MKRTLMAFLLISGVLSTSLVRADCPVCDKRRAGAPVRDLGEVWAQTILQARTQLGLSDDQMAKLQKMRSDTLKSIIAREADIKTARLELNDILHQPNPNLREARSRVKKVSDLQLGIRMSLLDSYERSLGVLSREQKDRFFKQIPVPGPHRFDEAIIGPDSSTED